MKAKHLLIQHLLIWVLMSPLTVVVAVENDFVIKQLTNDCFQEWQTRDWRLGEDAARVADMPSYVEAIKRICGASAELFVEGYPVSPFIHQSQRVILPFIFSGQNADVRQWLLNATTED